MTASSTANMDLQPQINPQGRRTYEAVALACAVFALSAVGPASRAAESERFRLRTDHATRHFEVGCIDHRSLMFVVGNTEGDDPEAARLLAERDCRPLVAGASYVKCGGGGLVHPARGAPLPYTAYCRIGVADFQLYVLDLLMERIVAGESGAAAKPK